MAGSLYISRDYRLTAAEDYDFLRKKGIEKIQALCGDSWTDYNEHDPGITLLEALCFTLTDLGYRASFDIKDMVAPAPGSNATHEKMFYTADQILPCNPVTLTDHRKLIVDMAGVRNAWIEKSADYEVPVYLEQETNGWRLTYDAEKGNELLLLKGLYRVIVEFEEDVKREGREDEVILTVKEKLHRHRNLCEDFVSISEVEYELFSIDSEIKVSEGADIELIQAQIYKVIRDLFSPAVNFYTLQQMQERGYTAAEIFEGPLLDHGFIDTKELAGMSSGKNIRLSDIISRITDIEGVIAIGKLAIPRESQSPFSEFTQWVGQIKDQEKTPRLDTIQSTIRFVRNGDRYRNSGEKTADQEKMHALLSFLLSSGRKVKLKSYEKDWVIPAGEYMNAGSYYPFQRNLPECYGMEENFQEAIRTENGIEGLDQHKKRVLQLRGYLMMFEQVLANYMAQLEHVKEFFSFDPGIQQNFFSQIPEGIHNMESLFIDMAAYKVHARELLENDHARLERRNKVLDHLLSRMGETMDDHSAHARIFFRHGVLERLMNDKAAFLQDLVQLSNYRGRGFNYSDPDSAWDTDNVSGVKKRVCRLLGMPGYQRKSISSDALYIDEVKHDNGITRYVAKLEDPHNSRQLLLQSVEYEFRKEASAILTYMLEQGMDRHLYDVEERHGQHGYSLKRTAGEGLPENVAFRTFHHAEEMERSFERTLQLLGEFSGEENFHLVEHILLRPRIGGRGLQGKKNIPVIDKEKVALLTVQATDDPIAAKGNGTKLEKAPYKFTIRQIKDAEQQGKEGWRLGLLNAEDEEILSVPGTWLFYKHLTTRMDHLRTFGADKVNYSVSRNADNYYIFSIMDADRKLAEGKKKYREEQVMDQELDNLVKFFSFEGSTTSADYLDEQENRQAALDPYSFHVSVVLPAWPVRFRDPGFRHLLEKTLFLEIPAHIYPHVYWLEHADMRRFEAAYRLWLHEQCSAAIPNTEILNNLLYIMEEMKLQ